MISAEIFKKPQPRRWPRVNRIRRPRFRREGRLPSFGNNKAAVSLFVVPRQLRVQPGVFPNFEYSEHFAGIEDSVRVERILHRAHRFYLRLCFVASHEGMKLTLD